MGWTERYFDAIDDIYHELKLIGLKKVRGQKIVGDQIVAPVSEMRSRQGIIYTKTTSIEETIENNKKMEVTLNHIVDIALSIVDNKTLSSILFDNFSFSADGDIRRVGKNISEWFGWDKRNDTITQHDGYYSSASSAIGLEIKLNATTSIEQIIKYSYLHVQERKRSNKSDLPVGILYVVPEAKLDKHRRILGSVQPNISKSVSEWSDCDQTNKAKNGKDISQINKLYLAERALFESVFSSIEIVSISWSEWVQKIESVAALSCGSDCENETRQRLLSGLVDAIRDCPLSGVKPQV